MPKREWRLVALSVIGFMAIAVIAVGAIAWLGVYNIGADAPHTPPVAGFLEYVREHSIDTRAADLVVPPLDNSAMVAEGAAHYDEMCTICHLGPGIPENEMRPGLNPKPPLLAKGAPNDPREAFWVIKHGIKMSAMPAWGATHTDQQIWAIVAFLQKLPHLSPAEYRALVAKGGNMHMKL